MLIISRKIDFWSWFFWHWFKFLRRRPRNPFRYSARFERAPQSHPEFPDRAQAFLATWPCCGKARPRPEYCRSDSLTCRRSAAVGCAMVWGRVPIELSQSAEEIPRSGTLGAATPRKRIHAKAAEMPETQTKWPETPKKPLCVSNQYTKSPVDADWTNSAKAGRSSPA